MGIDYNELDPELKLAAQVSAFVENAIERALLIQSGPTGLDDMSIVGLAIGAAQDIVNQFDISPKDEIRLNHRLAEIVAENEKLQSQTRSFVEKARVERAREKAAGG